MAPGECWLKEVGRLRMNDLLQNAPCCPIAVVACYSGSSADDHHVCRVVFVSPESDVYRPSTDGSDLCTGLPAQDV
jgi:hypothetical protein